MKGKSGYRAHRSEFVDEDVPLFEPRSQLALNVIAHHFSLRYQRPQFADGFSILSMTITSTRAFVFCKRKPSCCSIAPYRSGGASGSSAGGWASGGAAAPPKGRIVGSGVNFKVNV